MPRPGRHRQSFSAGGAHRTVRLRTSGDIAEEQKRSAIRGRNGSRNVEALVVMRCVP
ncbi:hypothetical protein ACWDA7_32830 [Streptomyces sp. NPDC001156]